VLGMSCASCALSVEKILKTQTGVTDASVSYANKSVFLEYDPGINSLLHLNSVVKSIGYELVTDDIEIEEIEKIELKRYRDLKVRLLVSVLLTLPVFVLSMFFHDSFRYENILLMVLSLPVIVWCGREFYINAVKQARHFSATMDTLVSLGTGAAFLYSIFNTFFPHVLTGDGLVPHVYFESATVIITFILSGRFLEERARTKASSSIRKLMSLQPKTLTVSREGKEMTISLHQVETGDIVLVKPGEKIPVDGKVTAGESFVDESMITGEPFAVRKSTYEHVFAGTFNQKGFLKIEAMKTGNQTFLSRIIKLVQEAQSGKPPVQKLADKIAGIFVPVVMILALISFFIWLYSGIPNAISYAFITMISVFIVACPCALGLATPTALIAGIGKGAENGILIRNAGSLEIAHKIDTIVFDKTGTVTDNKPKVTECEIFDKKKFTMVRDIIYSMECLSEHPVAGAITGYLKSVDASNLRVEKFESVTGKGIKAWYEGKNYFAGNLEMMKESHITGSDEQMDFARRISSEAQSVIYFSDSTSLLAVFAVSDEIKESTAGLVEELKKQGIKVHMLTGDTQHAASVIAKKAGITEFTAGMLPQDKFEYIKELQKQGRIVAMAGDGINDSAALAQADVGIALASGSDIAIENAGFILMKSDLQHILSAIKLSKATIRIIRQNLFWAFIYNIIAIPIAAGVLFPAFGFMLNPMIAGGAMAFSSVSVVSNSLRLKKIRLK